jgi:hypothetical protein
MPLAPQGRLLCSSAATAASSSRYAKPHRVHHASHPLRDLWMACASGPCNASLARAPRTARYSMKHLLFVAPLAAMSSYGSAAAQQILPLDTTCELHAIDRNGKPPRGNSPIQLHQKVQARDVRWESDRRRWQAARRRREGEFYEKLRRRKIDGRASAGSSGQAREAHRHFGTRKSLRHFVS